MPSGAAHRQLAAVTTPLVVLGCWTATGFPLIEKTWLDIGIVVAGYLANPVLLSPDMDLPQSSPSNKWNLLEPLWWPYQMLVHQGGGRNPLSHWPPLSTVFRLGYLWIATFLTFLAGVGIVNLIWFGFTDEWLIAFTPLVWLGWWVKVLGLKAFWLFLLGVGLGDILHVLADVLSSYMKK